MKTPATAGSRCSDDVTSMPVGSAFLWVGFILRTSLFRHRKVVISSSSKKGLHFLFPAQLPNPGTDSHWPIHTNHHSQGEEIYYHYLTRPGTSADFWGKKNKIKDRGEGERDWISPPALMDWKRETDGCMWKARALLPEGGMGAGQVRMQMCTGHLTLDPQWDLED